MNRFVKGRARTHRPCQMNSTERAYADHLEQLKLAGEIVAFAFESVKLRLADNTFYTPDFMVLFRDGSMAFHEVKGFWEDDARVKIKVAAALYWMWDFVAVQRVAKKRGGGWSTETIGRSE